MKAKQTTEKGNKTTPKGPKLSKKEPIKDLKNLFNKVELSVYNEISDDFSSKLSRARDHGHVQNKLYYHWAAESESSQKDINDIMNMVYDKYYSDNSLELIDAFLLVTNDENKLRAFARFITINEYLESIQNNDEQFESELNSRLPEFTTARQVLAMYYIFEEMKLEVDKKVQAKFIHFLTGKNVKNIYDSLLTPFHSKKAHFRDDDLKYIRSFFEQLKLGNVVLKIDKQLRSGKN